MKRNIKSRSGYSPRRVYDKKSGEYRPVFGLDKRREENNRSEKYATKQRRADNHKRRRKRALLLFYVFIFIVILTAAIVVSLTVLFKIDTIKVIGVSRYSTEQIVKAAGIKKGENLFVAKTRKASTAIEKKLPYISMAKVSRRLPARIFIKVKEEEISGAILYKGKYVVVSVAGKVLGLAGKMPKNCPIIKGLELNKAEIGKNIVYKQTSQKKIFNSLTEAISDNKLKKITAIDVSSPSKIQIVYDNRVTMNLGLPSNFDYKIRFAKSILDAGKVKDNVKGTLNLSVVMNDNAFFDQDYTTSSVNSSHAVQNSSNSSRTE